MRNSHATLFTINYHLYRTSISQVHDTPSYEQLERVVDVIKGEQAREMKKVLYKHYKTFSCGQKVPLEENEDIQLKNLDDNCNLAKRMTSDINKLVRYVAGFANGNGGHIYYGIELDKSGAYVAYGQKVDDQKIIIEKVKCAINKLLVWPGTKGCLKKGEQWDISFEDVLGTEEPKYVIVISVNSHDRGVFTREPESYVFDRDGNVKPMELCEWVERFRLVNYRVMNLKRTRIKCRGVRIRIQNVWFSNKKQVISFERII